MQTHQKSSQKAQMASKAVLLLHQSLWSRNGNLRNEDSRLKLEERSLRSYDRKFFRI